MGDISQSAPVQNCNDSSPVTFSIPEGFITYSNNTKRASGYEWTIPTGWVGPSGQTGTFFINNPDAFAVNLIPSTCSSGTEIVKVRAFTDTEGKGEPHYSNQSSLTVQRTPNISISTPPPSGIRCGVPFTASVPELLCADSYDWTVPPGWTISGTGRTRTITPLGTSGTISVNIPVAGGCTITTSQIITAPFNYVINGPSLICSTGVFSVGTLPTGSTISWSSSNPSGLSINSSTGSATRVNGYNGPI
ncbi:MAG: hypothetical protein LPJ98_10245, partial [Cyclobacteriaceae bacterium]|nr:hypothetical protein [Cyclobacteriaceae bacterium]